MSKDLFMMMREQEIMTDNFLPTKEEIQKSSKDFATKIIEEGEHNLFEVYAQSARMKEAINTIETELKKVLPDENFESFGVKGTFRNGGETINYSEDPVYAELERKLKERQEILKLALFSDDTEIYDSEGIEVPKVSKTPRKSSLAISF